MSQIDPDTIAIRVLLNTVRMHDDLEDDNLEDHPAQCCMMSFQKEWLEAGKALIRLEKRLKNQRSQK